MRTGNYILYAEDSPTDAIFFTRAFSQLGINTKLVHCNTGAELRDFLLHRLATRQALPRLIVSDIKMPGLTGLELLEFIRDHPDLRKLPVVLMSASEETRDIEQAYAHHANAYLVKPNRYKNLKQLVAAVIDFWVRFNRTAA